MADIRQFTDMTDADLDSMTLEECQHAIRTIRDFLIAASTNLPSVDDCLPSTSSSTSDAVPDPSPTHEDTLIYVTPAAALPNHR